MLFCFLKNACSFIINKHFLYMLAESNCSNVYTIEQLLFFMKKLISFYITI